MVTMDISPLVSVIMPSYNSAQYIASAVQSVIDQTFSDWELLIFNDGSTDNTDKVIQPFLKDHRIRYTKQMNMGQPKTRNKGIQLSRGSLIALLDADDIWMPTKLEKQISIFNKYKDVGVCGTSIKLIRPNGETFGFVDQKLFYGKAVPALITGELLVCMSTSVTQRNVFEKIGLFDEGFPPFSMDYDFWLRTSMVCMFYHLEERLVAYRTGHPSISMTWGDKRRDLVMNVVVPRFVHEYGGSKYVKWFHVWKLRSDCYYARAAGQKKRSKKVYWLFCAIMHNPKNYEAIGLLANQILPHFLVKLLKALCLKCSKG